MLEHFKKEAPNEKAYEELTVALAVLAGASPQRDTFRDHLKQIVPREIVMESWIYTDGKAEGEKIGEARALLRILESRKLKITQTERDKILTCRNETLLNTWLDQATTIKKVSDLFAKPFPAKKLHPRKNINPILHFLMGSYLARYCPPQSRTAEHHGPSTL